MHNPPVLTVRGLNRVGTDGRHLLRDLSLRLEAGERLAIAGPSGAGKTLLLRALVLLDPWASGRLEWRGTTPAGDRIPAYRRQVHYLAQKPALGEGPVEEALSAPWRLRVAGAERYDRERMLELLAAAGRDAGFLDRACGHLSGGEAQLVAVVRAIALAPRVLLLDEPTAAMDPDTRDAAERLLERWLGDDGERAWMWVSHDREQRRRRTDRTLRLDGGRLRGVA